MSAALLRAIDPAPVAWAAAVGSALEQVASTALELPVTRIGAVGAPEGPVLGAYIAVLTPGESLQIGIVADAASSETLVRALLRIAESDELAPGDVPDAFGEIANMVGGVAKAAMSVQFGVVGLGLPLVTTGLIAAREGIELGYEAVEVGAARVTLVVARSRPR